METKINYSDFVKTSAKGISGSSNQIIEAGYLKLMTAIYDITQNTGCSIRMIQIKALSKKLGLGSHPTMDSILAAMPTGKPTIQDAIKLREIELNHRREVEKKRLSCNEIEQENVSDKDDISDLRNQIVELKDAVAARDLQIHALNKRIGESEQQCMVYKNMLEDPRADRYEELLGKVFNVIDNSFGSFNTFRAKFDEIKNSKK